MPTIEPVVSEEKLRVLLAEQHESTTLDYKRAADLSVKRTAIELAKDIAAMQVDGGFIVIGADDRGSPTGLVTQANASLFDEARLRTKLGRWLPEPFDIRSANHVIDGELIVLVYIGPNPAGFMVMKDDGLFDNNSPLVFRRGDVYVRHGTASEIWNQGDIDRIINRRVAREKELWRADLSDEIRRLGISSYGTEQVAPLGVISWQLDAETFDASAIQLLRQNDDIPLRLLLGRSSADAGRLLESGDAEDLETLLDRLLELGSLVTFAGRHEWTERVIQAFVAIYERAFETAGQRDRAILWMSLMGRVFALGGLAVRTRQWPLLPSLVRQRPRGLHKLYLNWIRHAYTHAARADLPGSTPEGEVRNLTFVDLGSRAARNLGAARIDGASDDAVLNSVVQFDALAAMIAQADSFGNDSDFDAYYPTFHLWYSERVEPALTQILSDTELRNIVAPGLSDGDLARFLLHLAQPPPEIWSAAPWVGYETPDLTAFISSHV